MEASEGETLGQVLRAIRAKRGLTLLGLADRTGFSSVYHSLLERDERHGTFEVLAVYKRLGLDKEEVRAIKARCGLLIMRNPCATSCNHDGHMLPGPGPAGRDETCTRCSQCLDVFLAKWPDAGESHCSTSCTKRIEAPWHARYELLQEQRESGGPVGMSTKEG